MRQYRTTDVGKSQAKYHQALSMRRFRLAVKWVRKNHPAVWDDISQKAVKDVKSQFRLKGKN